MTTNPILRDFPDQFETERLLIRCLRFGDGAMLYEGVQESRAELRPWMPWSLNDDGVEGMETYVRGAVGRWVTRESLAYAILRKPDEMYIGSISLHHIEWDIPAFEIGYWQRTSCSGQGYMVEAVKGLTIFARDVLGARRMVIRCDTLNTKSKNVAERSDYALEAIVRNGYRESGGELRDDYVFSLTWPDKDK